MGSQEKIDQVRSILEKDAEILLAWVFGSVAQAKDRPDSDLDLAVVCAHPLSAEEQINISRLLEAALKQSIDLVDLSQAHGPIVAEVLCRGIAVVRRSPELHAQLLKRMWFEEADFGPLRRRMQNARRKKAFGT